MAYISFHHCAPTNPVEGGVYFDSAAGKIKFRYNGNTEEYSTVLYNHHILLDQEYAISNTEFDLISTSPTPITSYENLLQNIWYTSVGDVYNGGDTVRVTAVKISEISSATTFTFYGFSPSVGDFESVDIVPDNTFNMTDTVSQI